jgi:predicted regulator of Ras-like GTPase activity (Roadblock/LC7/MglB family)
MQTVLESLNELVGIRGSLVVSRDGMVIASRLSVGLDEDRVAAMASNVVLRTGRALTERGLGAFSRLSLTSCNGEMVFESTGEAYLVVVMERGIDLGQAELEIRSTARRIGALGEIRIA